MLRALSTLLALVVLTIFVGPARGEPSPETTGAQGTTPEVEPKKGAAGPDAQSPQPVAPVAPVAPEVAPPDPLQLRADRIRALIEGTLELSVDPSALFVIDLSDPALVGPAGERLRALLLAVAEPPPEPEPAPRRRGRRAPEPEPEPETERTPVEALAAALTDYLRLSAQERAAVLATHAERQAEAVAEREASTRREALRTTIQQRAERLEAFLAGTLELTIQPRDLLTLDLGSSYELALSSPRREAWTTATARPEPEPEPEGTDERAPQQAPEQEATPQEGEPTEDEATPPPDPAEDALLAAQIRLDVARQRFLALSKDQQDALFETHQRRRREAEDAKTQAEAARKAEAEAAAVEAEAVAVLDDDSVQEISDAEAEADAAAAEQQKALAAAKRARTEANRILEEERARLFSIKEAQARYSADINRRKAERIENHDASLEWRHRVDELERSPLFGSEREAKADELYASIRSDLATARNRLREELRQVQQAGASIPTVGDGLDRELAVDIDRGDIVDLREELQRNEAKLTQLEEEVAWELAQGLRDDVVLLNRTRLTLLDMASPSLHDEVTGFGSVGVDQVKRELDQISVELGFHLLKLPRYGDFLLELTRGSPFQLALGVVQLLFVLAALVWWRRRAPDLLLRARKALARRRPLTRWSTAALSVLWFFDRVRRPLELLAALWVVFSFAGELDDFPELMLLWIVIRWVLFGLAVILLLDAFAARETRYKSKATDTSALRIHSLRVVGINVIAVGMLLGLTSAMVGKGAIYSWVLSTCWILSVPVVFYLVYRWRPTIRERLRELADTNAFVAWARDQEEGPVRFVAAFAGAVYLLGRGVGGWFMRHLSGLEATRRVLAYLFRREVAKRAAAVAAAETIEPIDAACYGTFDPDRLEPVEAEIAATAELDRVAQLVEPPRSTLSAVVAERGMGKTTFLRRLSDRLGPERIKVVSCPEVGIAGLLPRIAALTGDHSLEGDALRDAVRQMGPQVIAIDDVQRLIQPAIRGLRELDQLIAFARSVGGQVSWVITMGSAAWHYLQRARGDRVFFEQVITLPRWSEEQLGQLIRSRCELAGIDPSFDGLVVPRQADTLGPEEDRTQSSYYRLLWDFSRGNPAVALHAFRESLFVEADGRAVVRLFLEPPSAQIENLSPPLLFVLRAIVQLDVAREHELVAATLLPTQDVSDALRFCLARGYIEPSDAGVRLTWRWFRTITTVLQRQHLLSAP